MKPPEGFLAARTRVIAALKDGRVQHDARDALAEKNLLAVGAVTPAEVISVLERCRGGDHTASPHHASALADRGVKVHVFETAQSGECWYIKAYFLSAAPPDDNAIFISVHH